MMHQFIQIEQFCVKRALDLSIGHDYDKRSYGPIARVGQADVPTEHFDQHDVGIVMGRHLSLERMQIIHIVFADWSAKPVSIRFQLGITRRHVAAMDIEAFRHQIDRCGTPAHRRVGLVKLDEVQPACLRPRGPDQGLIQNPVRG